MIFGKQICLNIFFSNNKKAILTLNRITKWSSKKTLKENAGDLGIDYQSAVQLAKNYKLEYKRIHKHKIEKFSIFI